MIIAGTITCTSTVEKPNFVELIPNWAATLECDLPAGANTWINFFQSPELVVGALAAIGTLLAVGVALKQSYDAKEAAGKAEKSSISIAERGEQNAIGIAKRAEAEAVKLALLNRELDNFEIFADWIIDYAFGLLTSRQKHLKDTTSMTMSARKLVTYAGQREPKFADALMRSLDTFQRVGMEINTAKFVPVDAKSPHAGTAIATRRWLAANADAAEGFVLTASALSKEVTDYYANTAGAQHAISRITELDGLMKNRYKILLEHSYAESADLDELISRPKHQED